MQANVTVRQDLTPTQLAEALANATPEEFAKFWYVFAENMIDQKKDKELKAFAKAMSPRLGSLRKEVFYKLHRLIQFYEIQEQEGQSK